MKSHSLKPFDDGKYLSEEEALKLLESIPIPKELEEKPEIPPASTDTTKQPAGKYILMPATNTYALGLHSLQEECMKENNQNHPHFTLPDNSKIYRPLTFKENIQARVEHYETTHNPDGSERTLDERLSLITGSWNDSCTAVVYKTGTTRFKIVPISEHLITLNPSFRENVLQTDYSTISGTELDSRKGTYNILMSRDLVLKHEGWLAAVEGDGALLKSYADIIFTEIKREYDRIEGMGFCVKENTLTDELRALFVSDLNGISCAFGHYGLHGGSRLLRRSPPLGTSQKNGGSP